MCVLAKHQPLPCAGMHVYSQPAVIQLFDGPLLKHALLIVNTPGCAKMAL